jgi:ubiquitin-protein ligase
MLIPNNYPEVCPKIFFKTKVFNSRINYETGELDLKVRNYYKRKINKNLFRKDLVLGFAEKT